MSFLPDGDGADDGVCCCCCCLNAAKGFLSFFGAGRATGVQELFNGSILSSSAGFVGVLEAAGAAGAAGGAGGGEGARGGGGGGLAAAGDALKAGLYIRDKQFDNITRPNETNHGTESRP